MKALRTRCMGTGLYVQEARTFSKMSRKVTASSFRRAKNDTELLLRNCARFSTSRVSPRSQLGFCSMNSCASISQQLAFHFCSGRCGLPCGPPLYRSKDDTIDRPTSKLSTCKSFEGGFSEQISVGYESLTRARASINSLLRASISTS